MRQRLKVYLVLLSIIFIVSYFISEYYVKRVNEEANIYYYRLGILANTHEILYLTMGIQEGLYSLLYGTFETPDPIKGYLKELEDEMDSLSRKIGYIFYAGEADEQIKVFSHHVEVLEVLYPKYIEKVNAISTTEERGVKERYAKEAIEIGEGLEVLAKEIHNIIENEHERMGNPVPSMINEVKKIRNITAIFSFIAIAISSFLMFYSCKVYKKILPFLQAVKGGDYSCKIEAGNDTCGREIVSTFKTVIERIKEGEKVSESLSIIDPLTGAYNRRYFDMRITEEMNRCMRYGTIFSLSMIDIDHFKEINDTFGHQVGDLVLKEIVMLIKENVRETDMVARFGGEEFMIIYPCTPKSGVLTQVERLRGLIEAHKFMDLNRTITISVGAADSAGKNNPEQVIEEADSNLYFAKRTGRNRCVIAGVTAQAVLEGGQGGPPRITHPKDGSREN